MLWKNRIEKDDMNCFALLKIFEKFDVVENFAYVQCTAPCFTVLTCARAGVGLREARKNMVVMEKRLSEPQREEKPIMVMAK